MVGALIAISLSVTFLTGLRRGMDHVAVLGPYSEQRSIAVALSDVVYKLNLGYIGYTSVLDALLAVWNKGAADQHDPILEVNGNSREILNGAIHAAASLGPQNTGYLTDFSLFTMYYDDLGYVDYVKWAFRLFGFKYEAMYYLFFTIFALSSLAFLVTFRSNPIALAVLLANVFVFLIEIHVGNFSPVIPTFAGMRHGSTLGLLPMWHFVFLTVARSRLSITNIVLAVFQLAILVLAIKMRGSATWMALFIVAVALFCAVWPWWRRSAAPRSWTQLARSLAQWPAILLLAGLFTNSLYMNATLHPAYFTDDAVPYHTVWHSIYLGWVASSPELASPYVRDMIAKGANGDMVGYYAALEYLRDTHFMASDPNSLSAIAPALMSAWYGGGGAMKYELYNKIMRHVVVDIVRIHPIEVLKIILVSNPIQAFTTIAGIIGNAPSYIWELLVVLSGLAMAAVQATARRLAGASDIRVNDLRVYDIMIAIALVAASVPFAAVINLLTYAAPWAVADLLLSLLIFFQIAIWGTATLAMIGLRQIMLKTAHS